MDSTTTGEPNYNMMESSEQLQELENFENRTFAQGIGAALCCAEQDPDALEKFQAAQNNSNDSNASSMFEKLLLDSKNSPNTKNNSAIDEDGNPRNDYDNNDKTGPKQPDQDYWLCDVYPEDRLILGQYQLKGGEFLGAGADSITRQAVDVMTGKRVAVRRYDLRDEKDIFSQNRRWFKYNALVESHSFFKHAHAVVLYLLDYTKDSKGKPSVDSSDHCAYAVLELGAFTLQDYLSERRSSQDGGLTLPEILEIFLCISETVATLHREKCVHLNLTPAAFIHTAEERKWKLFRVSRVRKSNSVLPIEKMSKSKQQGILEQLTNTVEAATVGTNNTNSNSDQSNTGNISSASTAVPNSPSPSWNALSAMGGSSSSESVIDKLWGNNNSSDNLNDGNGIKVTGGIVNDVSSLANETNKGAVAGNGNSTTKGSSDDKNASTQNNVIMPLHHYYDFDAEVSFDPLYMSPELATCIRSARKGVRVSQSMDIWSFGCVFAELFLDKPLFQPTYDKYGKTSDYLHVLCNPKPDYDNTSTVSVRATGGPTPVSGIHGSSLVPVSIRRFDMSSFSLLKKMLRIPPQLRTSILDLMQDDLYRRALEAQSLSAINMNNNYGGVSPGYKIGSMMSVNSPVDDGMCYPTDAELARELQLIGVSANRDRRSKMLEGLVEAMKISGAMGFSSGIFNFGKVSSTGPGKAANTTVGLSLTIPQLRTSTVYTSKDSGRTCTKYIETPFGYSQHQYRNIEEFELIDEFEDFPTIDCPPEPEEDPFTSVGGASENPMMNNLNLNSLKNSENNSANKNGNNGANNNLSSSDLSMLSPKQNLQSGNLLTGNGGPIQSLALGSNNHNLAIDKNTTNRRISWNFQRRPLYESGGDYFLRWERHAKEHGPFSAAQIRVWNDRGFFNSGETVLVRNRFEKYYRPVSKADLEFGGDQLDGAEFPTSVAA